MVSLADALFVLYSSAIPNKDYLIADDGSGPKITKWDSAKLGPEPTSATIAGVTDQQVADAKASAVRNAAASLVGATTDVPVAVRAVALVLQDGLNEIRQKVGIPVKTEADGMAAIAAAISSGRAG